MERIDVFNVVAVSFHTDVPDCARRHRHVVWTDALVRQFSSVHEVGDKMVCRSRVGVLMVERAGRESSAGRETRRVETVLVAESVSGVIGDSGRRRWTRVAAALDRSPEA